jgi:hypothetical protein
LVYAAHARPVLPHEWSSRAGPSGRGGVGRVLLLAAAALLVPHQQAPLDVQVPVQLSV